jgi:hypothetical protein
MRNRGGALLSRFNGFMLLLSFPCYIDYRVCLPPIADEKQQTTPVVYCVTFGELSRGKAAIFQNATNESNENSISLCTAHSSLMKCYRSTSVRRLQRAGGSARHGRLVRLLCTEL